MTFHHNPSKTPNKPAHYAKPIEHMNRDPFEGNESVRVLLTKMSEYERTGGNPRRPSKRVREHMARFGSSWRRPLQKVAAAFKTFLPE